MILDGADDERDEEKTAESHEGGLCIPDPKPNTQGALKSRTEDGWRATVGKLHSWSHEMAQAKHKITKSCV